MALELEGRIVRKMNVQTGVSARGSWAKQEFVLEFQDGNYPAQVCMNVWGEDKVKDLDKYQVGDSVKVAFRPSSREFNGKWYTDLRAWRVEPAGSSAAAAQPGQMRSQQQTPPPPQAPMPSAADIPSGLDDDDDLPF